MGIVGACPRMCWREELMDRNLQMRTLAIAMMVVIGGVATAQEAPKPEATPAPAATNSERRTEKLRELDSKQDEIKRLEAQAREITAALAKLAADGNLPTTEEAVDLMRQMVDQLEDINERLEKLTGEVEEIKGWIEGQNESQPVLAFEVAEARRFRPSLYMQFQYRNSDRQTASTASRPSYFGVPFSGSRESAFFMRRVRVGGTYTVDPRTSMRLSFDMATGTDQLGAQLRDAALIYVIQPNDRFVATELTVGQFAIPLGFELERSSADREFPERAQYNRIMFNGERTRGAMIRHALSNNISVSAGLGSSLTYADPEQSPRGSTPNGRTAFFGNVRYETTTSSIGIGTFQGERPAFRTAGSTGTATSGTLTVVTAPRPVSAAEVYRRFYYLDASFIGVIDPKLTLRFEGMRGTDRIPIANTQNAAAIPNNAGDIARTRANEMNGWQIQATYNLTERVQLFGRAEGFDPDIDQDNDAITGQGLGFRYFINPNASVAFTAERWRVPQFTDRRTNSVYTIRYQFRF